ncbi:Butyrophilin subfamily 3 member A3 [Nibea albiflora]|nr:Butyrophilin subfamily 3 member A3 [Nibea albiflora]
MFYLSVTVTEDDDVILPCSINANMETGTFDWKKDGQTEVFLYKAGSHYNNGLTGQDQQFKGRVSHFEEELKHGNASIKITNTKMADSGDYTCTFPNNYPGQPAHVKLVVAAPKPYIKILDVTETSALLQCEAHGIPDLEVHWQDSDGNILPAEEPQVTESGGFLYIAVKTTVTKTGRFHCVATQENIGHTISAKTYVRLPGE